MRLLFPLLTLVFGLVSFPYAGALASNQMHDAQVEAFESKGIRWTVTPTNQEKSDSGFPKDFAVRSESGEIGYAEPAWAGDDPGELGPLWAVYNSDGIVIGTCSSSLDHPAIKCINILLHEAFPPSPIEPPCDSPQDFAKLDQKKPEVIRFSRDPFEIKPSRLPSSQMPNSLMPSSQMPSSQFPVSRMPDTRMPDSSLPDTHMPSSKDPALELAPSRISTSPFFMWP